jgi:integrase/recombinase XerD
MNPMSDPRFVSSLADAIVAFIAEKRNIGYRYVSEVDYLRMFDRHLVAISHTGSDLPKEVVRGWVAKRSHESGKTHKNRLCIVSQLARFLVRHGGDAYVPDSRMRPVERSNFAPWIFTRGQVARFLAATSVLGRNRLASLRHLVMPELFRVLYGCGLRCGEALRLTVRDVDLHDGILTIREGKFRQDRLVLVAPGLLNRLRAYAETVGRRPSDAIFFPAPHRGAYSRSTIYDTFRCLLRTAGIPHGGRGVGPRLHDLRASFAVHRLEAWYREGADLSAKLVVLSTYMGHRDLAGTQRYLRLTQAIFPHLNERFEQAYGHVLPRLEVP